MVDRRGPGIVVRGRWPPMPILEWWDVWYRQIPGAAQVDDRMSRGVQWGLRELGNAGQGSPAPERQRSTPLESSPAVTTAPQPSRVGESFEEFYKSVWDRPLGAGAASESSGKAPKPPRLPAPPPPEETSTPGSKEVPKSLFQSARKELRKEKRTSAKAEAPPAKAQVSGDKKPKKKAKTGSGASSKKRKIAPDSSETDESDPLFEEHEWVPAAKHIPKKKKKKVVPAPSSDSDSGKLSSDTAQDVKALATELAAGSKDGDKEKAIRAESAHASALEVCAVEPVKCSSTARLNRLNHGFTIFSFLQSLNQAQQRRLAVQDTRKQLRQRFGWAANTPIRWVIVDGPDGEPPLAVGTPGKATKGTPRPKKGEELVFLPPQWEEEGDAAGTTWPVIAVKDSASFSNPHVAEEALKERRAQKQQAIDEEGKKTMEDSPSYSPLEEQSPSYSPLEEKEVTPAPEAEAEKDSDNGVPVPTPPVIPEPKDTEKHIPVPSPPEVPEPKESEEQVVKEEKVESAGPGVQEHQHSGEDSPAAPVGQEEIEEVDEAPKDEEMPACKQEDNEEAAPEVGAPVPHVKEEPLPND